MVFLVVCWKGDLSIVLMFLLLQLFSGELAAKGDRFSMFLLLQLFSRELPAKGDKFSMSEFVPLKWLLVLLLVMLDIYGSSMTIRFRGSFLLFLFLLLRDMGIRDKREISVLSLLL